MISKISKAVGGLLVFTGLLGLLILAEDQVLWASAASHAYTLIAFVILDLVMAALVLLKSSKMVFTLVAAWSGLRVALQIGDVFLAPTFQLTYAQFADYLFNPTSTTPPNSTGIPGALIDLILLSEVIIVALALSNRKRTGTSGSTT